MELPLYDKVLIITGNSASGKTKMLNWLKACKDIPQEVKYSSINLDDIIVITDKEGVAHLLDKKPVGKFIFIDRYTFLGNNIDLYNFIMDSKNVFVIMGHRNTSGLTSQDAVLALRHDGIHYTCEQIYTKGLFEPIEII